jgi:hypothetical protein
MANIIRATANGEQHGLVNTLTNSVEFNDFKHMNPTAKAKIEKEKKEDSKIVKVEYINKKGNHERLDKPYCRYSGDPILMYHLIPGYTYDLPLGFVKEVNEMKKVTRSGLVSLDGENVTKDGSPLDKDVNAEWEHKLIPIGY